MKLNRDGYTLVELLVVMAVFITVIAITGDAFKTILSQTAKLFRSEESNIEGITGLEMLRHDLQQAGFGLFSETSPVPYGDEVVTTVTPASSYNDGVSGPPRPLVSASIGSGSWSYTIPSGTDYLVIKATTVGMNRVSQKWSYLMYSSTGGKPHVWGSASENFALNDRVVLVRRQVDSTNQTTSLVENPTPSSSGQGFNYSYGSTVFRHLSSAGYAVHNIYGVADGDLRMPFNRADYFIHVPDSKPPVCSTDPKVGVLYKAVVNNSTGGGDLTLIPVLDCVADMQLVLGWDLKDGGGANGNDGVIDTWSDATGDQTIAASSGAWADDDDVHGAMASAAAIRNSLKVVKVYILAQQGRMDPSYTSPSPILVGDDGETSLTRSYTLTSDMLHYRWKLFRIIARPKNLPANQ